MMILNRRELTRARLLTTIIFICFTSSFTFAHTNHQHSPSGISKKHHHDNDIILQWNTILLDAIKTNNTNPPKASRAMAMMHCAVFNAVNGLAGRPYQMYHFNGIPPKHASANAAAASAAHRILVTLYSSQQVLFDVELENSLENIPNPEKNRGKEWGEECANAIIELRSNDHSSDVVAYAPYATPGFWIPTPPALASALLPNWPYVTPWAMTRGDQFIGFGPPDLMSEEYAIAFNEVKELGNKVSSTRTAEQTEIALFWADGGGTVTPPGHWNRIAQSIVESKENSLLESARLFALLNIAMADAAICAWDNKYYYNHWRPITGIRMVDNSGNSLDDGNPLTEADLLWTPLITTPPFPSYTSGHSTFSSAAARILGLFYKRDHIHFETTSEGLPEVTRSFNSFSEAAKEAGQSRIYGGIHWQYDNQDALKAGRQIADHVYYHVLKSRYRNSQ